MQDAYVPERQFRVNLMFEIAIEQSETELKALDLGCGPGSVALRVVARCPKATVVAVDSNDILLEIGRRVSNHRHAPVEFRLADIRCSSWWDNFEDQFDAVLSATALHWPRGAVPPTGLQAHHECSSTRWLVRQL